MAAAHTSLIARRATFSPEASFTLSMLMLSLPPRPILLFGCAAVTVPQAILPRGTTITSLTFTSVENFEIHRVVDLRIGG
jgi:hypothetical protein